MRFSRAPDFITIALLFFVGLMAVLTSLSDTIQFAWFPTELDLLRFIAATMGVVLFTLGIERITIFLRQERRMENIELLTKKVVRCVREIGYKKVIDEGTEIAGSANKEIRTVAVGPTHTAPTSWSKTIAKRLAESKKQEDVPIYFTSVTIIDPDAKIDDFVEGMEERLGIYRKYDVIDLVRHYVLESRLLGFDIMIIDDTYLAIGVPRGRDVKDPNRAIILYDMPDLVVDFSDWHRDVLLETDGLKLYSEWRAEKQPGSI